jgi:type I restriction enzyme S subunit
MKNGDTLSLPKSWKKVLLKDACKVFTDGDWIESKDQSQEGIRLVQTGNIGFGYFKDKEDKSRFISEETFQRLKCTEILAGDLLVSRLPDPVGKSCIIPEIDSKMITGVDCTIIRPKDDLSSLFLCYYQMSNQYLNDVQSGVSGATRQRISRKNLGQIEIPLPSLPEQQRIVTILDEAFAAIAKAKANAEQNLKNAKELFESYLQGVFENGNWETKKLNEIT